MDLHDVLIQPIVTEAAFELSVSIHENKIVFIVRNDATKPQIKKAVEMLYQVKVEAVNTLITPFGKKKAFVKLHPDFPASDIVADWGMF